MSVDLTAIPPVVELCEPDDFKSFSVVVRGENAWVPIDQLERLAGDRGKDDDWKRQLSGMAEYARTKGWVREDGALRAHVERTA